MPLVANRCKKHSNAHPENECPICVREETELQRDASKLFFKNQGEHVIPMKFFEMRDTVTVEQLYQHFRARMLDELTPVLRDGKKAGE